MSKLNSPLYKKSPDTLSICGKLLRKDQPIIVPKHLLTDKVKAMSEKGIIKIRNVNDNEVQILRK